MPIRSISAIQGLLQGLDRGDSAPGPQRRRLGLWILLHLLAALVALLWAYSGGITVKDFVFGAMTGGSSRRRCSPGWRWTP